MSEHTKEPWAVRIDEKQWSDTDDIYIVGNPTGEAGGTRNLARMIESWEQPIPNANRIVACVNACAGISTDDLERLPLISDRAFVMMEGIAKQRDELLAELKQALHWLIAYTEPWLSGGAHYEAFKRDKERIVAAIAKVESK